MNELTLEMVYYFRAPRDHDFNNVIIEKSQLYVEILLGGIVFYEGKSYSRRVIFAHTEGMQTVHDFPDRHPYRVLALIFRGYNREKHPLPHIGYWLNEQTLDAFVEDSLNAFHTYGSSEELRDLLFSTVRWNLTVSSRSNAPEEIVKSNLLELRNALAHPDCYFSGWPGLCRRAGYSSSYLKNLFKKEFGISPYQFHLNARLERAGFALRNSTNPIRQISNDTGFQNIESFYRAFKRHFGISPAKYRMQWETAKVPQNR